MQALLMMMRCKEQALVHWDTCCSNWVWMSRSGTGIELCGDHRGIRVLMQCGMCGEQPTLRKSPGDLRICVHVSLRCVYVGMLFFIRCCSSCDPLCCSRYVVLDYVVSC